MIFNCATRLRFQQSPSFTFFLHVFALFKSCYEFMSFSFRLGWVCVFSVIFLPVPTANRSVRLLEANTFVHRVHMFAY